MAEGIVGALLGGESEEAEANEAQATTLDPAAAAAAMDAAKSHPVLAEKAAAYFDKQARLVDIQTEHLHEQREVMLSHLKLRRLGERLKVGMQIFFAVVATAIGGGLLAMIWQAAYSRVLVIETFSVPPDLVHQGLTGETLALQVQDQIARYGEESKSARAPASYEDSWGEKVKVEIPETGMSLNEFQRFLRERLGHDLHISGEVVNLGGKVAVTVRVGEEPAMRVEGDVSSLDSLVNKAALDVFARTEPYRHTLWLAKQPERAEEAKAALRRLTMNPSKEDQIWAWVGLNATEVNAPLARSDIEKAIRIDPTFGHLWFDLIQIDSDLGHDEAVLADARTGRRYTPDDRGRRITPLAADWSLAVETAAMAREGGDFPEEIAAWRSMEGRPDYSGLAKESAIAVPIAFARLHDPAQAIALTSAVTDDLSSLKLKDKGRGLVHFTQAILAADRADWTEAARQLEGVESDSTLASLGSEALLTKPYLAVALAHIGRATDAATLLASMPADRYDGLIARAIVADLTGDKTGAGRWFAEAVNQGPSLPRAWQAWGERLLARGDLDGAESKFKAAIQLGPHWADPLKAWGDVLVGKGNVKEALVKYDEALKYAPAWRELHEARDATAKRRS